MALYMQTEEIKNIMIENNKYDQRHATSSRFSSDLKEANL
jgi:hypothetical protein